MWKWYKVRLTISVGDYWKLFLVHHYIVRYCCFMTISVTSSALRRPTHPPKPVPLETQPSILFISRSSQEVEVAALACQRGPWTTQNFTQCFGSMCIFLRSWSKVFNRFSKSPWPQRIISGIQMNKDAIPTGKRFYVGRGGLASELISKDKEVECMVRRYCLLYTSPSPRD